jgi:hypothetical protein
MGMQKFKAPLLPLPPKEYEQSYLVQLIRTLGLYFTQMDSTTSIVTDSAQFINIPESTEYADLIPGSLYRGVGSDVVQVKVNGIPYSPVASQTYVQAQVAAGVAAANAYTNTTVANYVPLAGGTMTGTLVAPTINSTTINSTTINSTTVNAPTLNSANATVSNATGGTIRAPGMILQVKQAIKTDTFTQVTVGNTYYPVPGLEVKITPTSATSKILVTCTVNLGSSSYQGRGIVYRNGVPLGLGDTASLRTGVSFGFNAYAAGGGDDSHVIPCNFTFLDSPTSTSELTYSISVSAYDTVGISVNRAWTWSDLAEYDPAFSSTITVMEIAG